MMSKYGLVTLLLGCGLMSGVIAACTPAGEETPSPDPVIESTVAATVTPTPQWKPDEQTAINAVQTYIDKWTYIGQNLSDTDPNAIWEVAGPPAANNALQEWALWIQHDWHLIGTPEFDVIYVNPGATDDQGKRYHVYGCYSSENAFLTDVTGVPFEKGAVRATMMYLVLITPSQRSWVLEETDKGELC